MDNIDSRVVITGAVNLEAVNNLDIELVGAGIYLSVSAAKFSKEVTLISCIGEDTENMLIDKLNYEFESLPLKFIFQRKKGKNFLHKMNTVTHKEIKIFGDYKNFIVEDIRIKAKYLVLGTATPKLQKSILACCEQGSIIAWDSKEIYYRTQIQEIKFFLPLIHIYTGTEIEVNILLSYLGLSKVEELFGIYRNLQYIFYKKGAEGGCLYICNGVKLIYTISMTEQTINDCGAGDILLGAFVGLLDQSESNDIVSILREAVRLATMSTGFHGIKKLKDNVANVNVDIEMKYWRKAREVKNGK